VQTLPRSVNHGTKKEALACVQAPHQDRTRVATAFGSNNCRSQVRFRAAAGVSLTRSVRRTPDLGGDPSILESAQPSMENCARVLL